MINLINKKQNSSKNLTSNKQEDLFIKYKNGDITAKNMIIEQNMSLVSNIVRERFYTAKKRYNYNGDYKDLESIGYKALIQAAETFDISMNNTFSTYAYIVIYHKILNYIKEKNNNLQIISLSTPVCKSDYDKDVLLSDILTSDINIEEEYLDYELKTVINKFVKKLPEPERDITRLYFGFYDNKPKTQEQISKIHNISRAKVSTIINEVIQLARLELQRQSLLEINIDECIQNEKYCDIYKHFKTYTKEQVDLALGNLPKEEQEFLNLYFRFTQFQVKFYFNLTDEQYKEQYLSVSKKLRRNLKYSKENMN